MITKTIDFTDPFKNVPVQEEAHFHLNKNDILTLQAEAEDAGFSDPEKHFYAIMASGKNLEIYETFKKFILKAYGRRQGSKFVKSQAISDDFASTEAFSEFIFYLLSHEEEAGVFFTSLMNVPVERAPMLKDTQPTQAQPDVNNVFVQPAPDPGPVVNTMPPAVDPSVPEEAKVEKKDNRPRLLTRVEQERMTFAEVVAGVTQGLWRVE